MNNQQGKEKEGERLSGNNPSPSSPPTVSSSSSSSPLTALPSQVGLTSLNESSLDVFEGEGLGDFNELLKEVMGGGGETSVEDLKKKFVEEREELIKLAGVINMSVRLFRLIRREGSNVMLGKVKFTSMHEASVFIKKNLFEKIQEYSLKFLSLEGVVRELKLARGWDDSLEAGMPVMIRAEEYGLSEEEVRMFEGRGVSQAQRKTVDSVDLSSSDDSSPDSSPELPAKDVSPIFSPFDLKHASPPTTPLVPVVEPTKVKVEREAEVVSEGYLKIQQRQKVTLPQMPKKPASVKQWLEYESGVWLQLRIADRTGLDAFKLVMGTINSDLLERFHLTMPETKDLEKALLFFRKIVVGGEWEKKLESYWGRFDRKRDNLFAFSIEFGRLVDAMKLPRDFEEREGVQFERARRVREKLNTFLSKREKRFLEEKGVLIYECEWATFWEELEKILESDKYKESCAAGKLTQDKKKAEKTSKTENSNNNNNNNNSSSNSQGGGRGRGGNRGRGGGGGRGRGGGRGGATSWLLHL